MLNITMNRPLLLFIPLLLTSCSSPAPDPAESKAYLEKAAAVPGAVRTPSGLVYRELRAGTGTSPNPADTVRVNYRGTLVNGTKFDSSVDAHTPFDFNIGKGDVIKGWDEGVTGMKVGGKRQLRIPPELAYGASGYPPVIPSNATLIFDIQLLAVK